MRLDKDVVVVGVAAAAATVVSSCGTLASRYSSIGTRVISISEFGRYVLRGSLPYLQTRTFAKFSDVSDRLYRR